MQRLTRVEEDIMNFIWQLERCTVSQLIEQLPGKPPPHSTISSIVRILEKKGFLSHEAYGRSYVYFPIISKRAYQKTSLLTIAQRYFNHSVEDMVSFLVSEREISLSDLQSIIEEE